jgi:hypothetical protein
MPGSDAEEDAPDQEGHVPNVEVPEQWLPVDGLRRLDGSDRYERFGDNQCAALQSKRRGHNPAVVFDERCPRLKGLQTARQIQLLAALASGRAVGEDETASLSPGQSTISLLEEHSHHIHLMVVVRGIGKIAVRIREAGSF